MQSIEQFLDTHHLDLDTLEVVADRRPARPFDADAREAREARGRHVAAARAIVGAGDAYLVEPSSRGAEPYRVTLAEGGACTCGDFVNRIARVRERGQADAACKHIVAVRLQVAAASAEGRVAA